MVLFVLRVTHTANSDEKRNQFSDEIGSQETVLSKRHGIPVYLPPER